MLSSSPSSPSSSSCGFQPWREGPPCRYRRSQAIFSEDPPNFRPTRSTLVRQGSMGGWPEPHDRQGGNPLSFWSLVFLFYFYHIAALMVLVPDGRLSVLLCTAALQLLCKVTMLIFERHEAEDENDGWPSSMKSIVPGAYIGDARVVSPEEKCEKKTGG